MCVPGIVNRPAERYRKGVARACRQEGGPSLQMTHHANDLFAIPAGLVVNRVRPLRLPIVIVADPHV
jgi:hypothetical protein